jgi:murein DD-endopeptidase MepM/ murein hydrolase activator NlpD
MGRWFGTLLAAVLLPLLCGAAYILLAVTLVGLTLLVVPGWARGPITDWMMDIPQATYSERIPPAEAGEARTPVPRIDGYVYRGARPFLCLLPPAHGYLSDYYGAERGGGALHGGIDYGCYYHTQAVRTPLAGKVIFAGPGDDASFSSQYGNLVVIENGGYRLYLGHNQQIGVTPGEVVEAGDIVAQCGSSGNSSGYHVHLEVRTWDGQSWRPQDPNRLQLPGQLAWCDWNALAVEE